MTHDWRKDPWKISVEEIVAVWCSESKKRRYESAMWKKVGLTESSSI